MRKNMSAEAAEVVGEMDDELRSALGWAGPSGQSWSAKLAEVRELVEHRAIAARAAMNRHAMIVAALGMQGKLTRASWNEVAEEVAELAKWRAEGATLQVDLLARQAQPSRIQHAMNVPDEELAGLASIVDCMEHLDADVQARVMRYLTSRYGANDA